MATAAEQGHTTMCEHLHAQQCPWNESVYYTAARSGHVDTVRWLQEHGCPRDATKVCQVAAMGGSIDVLLYVQQQGMVSTPARLRSMLNIAAVSEKLAAAQWLRQQGAEWPAVLKYNGKKWSVMLFMCMRPISLPDWSYSSCARRSLLCTDICSAAVDTAYTTPTQCDVQPSLRAHANVAPHHCFTPYCSIAGHSAPYFQPYCSMHYCSMHVKRTQTPYNSSTPRQSSCYSVISSAVA
eukprot:12121-Heterococcus_DN1.PRE.8